MQSVTASDRVALATSLCNQLVPAFRLRAPLCFECLANEISLGKRRYVIPSVWLPVIAGLVYYCLTVLSMAPTYVATVFCSVRQRRGARELFEGGTEHIMLGADGRAQREGH